MTDKKGRTNQKMFSATSNYNKDTGYFEGKTPSKVSEVGSTIFNLGQSDAYWQKKDIYGVGRLAGWSVAGLVFVGSAIKKFTGGKKNDKK